jgi:hypothetical protein
LALKPGDTRLTEISENFHGDYGVAFQTSLKTGIYQTTRDRFGFQFTEEMEYEFSNPQGTINLDILGYKRSTSAFEVVKTVIPTLANTTTLGGWDSFAWDGTAWDDTSVIPTVVSQSSDKRYSTVQAELNNLQWHVYTTTLDSKYILRTLQTWGTDTEGGHPGSWRT